MARTTKDNGDVTGFERDDNNFGFNRDNSDSPEGPRIISDGDNRSDNDQNAEPMPDDRINID